MTSIALITGANKGIGFETARLLGARGMTVLVGARDADRGEQAERALRGGGADAHFVWLDVTDEKAALNMVTAMYAKELHGTPIKVNAANPGYCATDLNANSGFRTAEQGAQVSVHLATLGDDGPTGTLWGYLWSADGSESYGSLPW